MVLTKNISNTSMQWIDTHVHLFTTKDTSYDTPLYIPGHLRHSPALYRETLNDNLPHGIVVVDFSKAPHSGHVIHSLDELHTYALPAKGIIKGDVLEPLTFSWIERKDIKGIRLYARDFVPDIKTPKEPWDHLFSVLERKKQHILAFGEGVHLLHLLQQLPSTLPVVIDHLGMPDIAMGKPDSIYTSLLQEVKKRGNVYFKGPGYRSSLSPEKLLPFMLAILDAVGKDNIILGASDGPFAGPVPEKEPTAAGRLYGEIMDYPKVSLFTLQLASLLNASESDLHAYFYANANRLYQF